MLPAVFQTLKASAAVKAIVGSTNPRIYRFGSAPQDIPAPYVTWFLVVGVPENNLSDPPPLDVMSVQIDCWHQSDVGCDALADAVRDAMELVCHMTAIVVNLRETETKLYRIGMQFDVFTGR